MYLAAVEIGGTKLQAGVGSAEGRLLRVERARVEPGWDAGDVRSTVALLLHRAVQESGLSRTDLAAIGIGFGGPVDAQNGRTIKSHHVRGWDDFPLVQWFETEFDVPAVLHNDADTAGLGEATYGAGKGFDPLFYITLGTGVGGGLIVGGEIYRGCGLGAAEIGHLKVLPMEPPDPRGRWYITEDLASGRGIAEQARSRAGREPGCCRLLLDECGGDPAQIRGEHVARAAAKGDPVARDVIELAVEALARAICHVVALLCPARIVIGGGASEMGEDLLFRPLRRRVSELVFPPFAHCFEIVPAALGRDVVLYGALELARRAAQTSP